MSHPAPNTSLSLSARLLCYIGPPSAILLTAAVSPKTALLTPIAFAPSAWFLRKWRQLNVADQTRRGELEPMLWIFASAGTLGLTTVALVQIVIAKILSTVIFRSNKTMRDDFWTEFQRNTIDGLTTDQLTRRAELASTWQNWAFNAVFFFVAAGLAEETLKYLPIVYARRRGTPKERKQRDRAYIDYAIAGALSFSLIEAIGFFYASVESMNECQSRVILTLFERSVGQVGHLACAALTALRATRRDFYGDRLSWWEVVGPAVLFHGAFDFMAISSSVLEGNVGWIHPKGLKLTMAAVGMCLGMVGMVVELVRREWKELNEQDGGGKSHEDEKKP